MESQSLPLTAAEYFISSIGLVRMGLQAYG